MDGATVISKEILEAAKGKDVDVRLNMGGYTWTLVHRRTADTNIKHYYFKINAIMY